MTPEDDLQQNDSSPEEAFESTARAPDNELDEMFASSVQEAEAEDAFNPQVSESVVDDEQEHDSAADRAVIDPAGDDPAAEEPGKQIDAELAAEVAEDLQQNLRGVAAVGTSQLQEAPSATKYRLVRTVEIEIDPPLTQPLTLGLGEDDWLFVLDRPTTDRFRLIRVPFTGGRGHVVVELEDGNAENALLDPVGIAVDHQGQMHIPDAEENCIKVFSPDGRWLQTFATAGEFGAAFDHPRDIDIAEDGHLYIADTYNNRLVKLTAEGEFVWEFEQFTNPETGDEDDELYEPGSVCVASGTAAIADTNQNRIVTVGQDGGIQGVLESHGAFEFPSEVRITEDGVIYVGDHSNLRVQRFAPDGTLTGLIDLRDEDAEMSGGGDIDIDSDGNVVMIDPVREALVVLGFVNPE